MVPRRSESLTLEQLVPPRCLESIVFPRLTRRQFNFLRADELAIGYRIFEGAHGPRYRLHATLPLSVHRISADKIGKVTSPIPCGSSRAASFTRVADFHRYYERGMWHAVLTP